MHSSKYYFIKNNILTYLFTPPQRFKIYHPLESFGFLEYYYYYYYYYR